MQLFIMNEWKIYFSVSRLGIFFPPSVNLNFLISKAEQDMNGLKEGSSRKSIG